MRSAVIVASNLALLSVLTAIAVVIGRTVRSWRIGRLGTRAILEGDPRRYRATLRLLRRKRLPWARPRELAWCSALFWEGHFDEALALVEPLLARRHDTASWSRAVALKILCLLVSERTAEARRLFDAVASDLVLVGPEVDAGADEALLEALLAFHEDRMEASREPLETGLDRLDARWPLPRLVHFHLAAIAHRDGQTDRARVHLEAAIRGGGDLFVARWAARAYEGSFPGALAIPRWSVPRASARPRRRPGLPRLLAAGLRVLSFDRRAADRLLRLDYEQVAALALLDVAWVGLLRCVDYVRGATFMPREALALAAPVLSFAVTALLATRGLRGRGIALRVTGAFYAALPALLLVDFLARRAYQGAPVMVSVVQLGVAAWSLGLFLFLVRRADPRARTSRLLAAVPILAVTWLAPMHYVEPFRIWIFWKPPPPGADDPDDRDLAAFTLHEGDLLHAAESQLRPQRPEAEDLYVLTFAGWGSERVFLNESQAFQSVFDRRFDTEGRSMVLASDPSVRETTPVATALNLGHALRAVAARMNRDDDVLVLVLSSHGNEGGLGLRAPEAPEAIAEGRLSPGDLRALLDEAAIRWRVLVISGCKAGVFVHPLENEFTLIATAAASDRFSFGCGSKSELTDYGRAVLDQLEAERFLPAAFARAADVVRVQEAAAGLTASEPQLFVGPAIEGKLRSIAARVSLVAAAPPEEPARRQRASDGGR